MDLQKLYDNYNYAGASKLYLLAKRNNIKTNMTEITNFLKKQKVNQIYNAPPIRHGHIIALFPFERVQMDLVDMSKFHMKNHGYNWILQLIDIFSRKIFVYLLKSKNIEDVKISLNNFLSQYNVYNIISDNESSFKSSEIQDVLNDYGCSHQMVEVGNHNALGVIDRSISTIKQKIYQFMKNNNTTKYSDNLDKIISAYNDTPHSGIKNYTPNEVFDDTGDIRDNIQKLNHEKNNNNTIKMKNNTFEIGDLVRIRNVQHKFTRSFDEKYSNQTFLIMNVQKRKAVLDDGTTVDLRRLKRVDKLEDLKDDNEDITEELKGKEEEPDELTQAIKENKIHKALKRGNVNEDNIVLEKRERRPPTRYS
jgi:hypothetical protein